jgi:photosystem II stability/assembly factor-like uncharacterized protein
MYRLRGGEWEQVPDIPRDAAVQSITPHPTRDDVIYAACRKGLYRSTDSGDTWHQLPVTDAPVQMWSVVVSPHDPGLLFAGTSPVGFFRSEDGGDTWHECECDHPERFTMAFGNSRAMRIAFHPADPRVIYAAAEVNGFLISEDGGRSWRGEAEGLLRLAQLPHLKNTELTDDDTEGVFDGHSLCTTSALPDSVFFAGRMGIFETSDRGKSFRDLEVGKSAPFSYTRDCRVVADDPGTFYACFSISSRSSTGALFCSDDLGKSWHRADEPMHATSTMMGFGLHVSDPAGIISVTRHGQIFHSTDGAATWTETRLPQDAGDAFCAAII